MGKTSVAFLRPPPLNVVLPYFETWAKRKEPVGCANKLSCGWMPVLLIGVGVMRRQAVGTTRIQAHAMTSEVVGIALEQGDSVIQYFYESR